MINSSSIKDLLRDKRRLSIDILIVVIVLIVVVLIFRACSNDSKDLGNGFKSTDSSQTKTTKPSSKANIDQPCSLLSKAEASKLLGKEVKTGTSEDVDKNTLRCRFDSLSADGKFFININVYVFKTKEAYENLRISNNGVTIETNVDGGFYAVREKDLETERIVAVVDGKNRIGLSASIASIEPNVKISPSEQSQIPDGSQLAEYAGKMMAKL